MLKKMQRQNDPKQNETFIFFMKKIKVINEPVSLLIK